MLQDKLLYSQQEAAQALSISKRSIGCYIAKRELETRRVGRRVLITAGSLKRFAARDHYEGVREPTNFSQKISCISGG